MTNREPVNIMGVFAFPNPNYAALLGTAILFQNAGKQQEAIKRLTLLIDEYPDKAEIYSIRAEIEKEANLSELAIMDLNKAIELDPDNKNIILSRAYLHLSEDNKRLALKDFEHAIELGVPIEFLVVDYQKAVHVLLHLHNAVESLSH